VDSPLYEGSHRELFEVFLRLADDSEAQTAALLDLTTWRDVRSLLSVGGGEGNVEATLLRNAPEAEIWYLDPSPEQVEAFGIHMEREHLLDRVKGMAESTFQDYTTAQKFDRIVSMFSWFFVGKGRRELEKLIDLLAPDGVACLVLPNTDSIEADFNRHLSPDQRTTLVGGEVVQALDDLGHESTRHTFTKWLADDEMFDGQAASEASLAFAAFVAMRPISELTASERSLIAELLHSRRQANGVPLSWDVIVVSSGSSDDER
jgi:SAM-dependent methyltransferase